jgi:hypothetical protein
MQSHVHTHLHTSAHTHTHVQGSAFHCSSCTLGRPSWRMQPRGHGILGKPCLHCFCITVLSSHNLTHTHTHTHTNTQISMYTHHMPSMQVGRPALKPRWPGALPFSSMQQATAAVRAEGKGEAIQGFSGAALPKVWKVFCVAGSQLELFLEAVCMCVCVRACACACV